MAIILTGIQSRLFVKMSPLCPQRYLMKGIGSFYSFRPEATALVAPIAVISTATSTPPFTPALRENRLAWDKTDSRGRTFETTPEFLNLQQLKERYHAVDTSTPKEQCSL